MIRLYPFDLAISTMVFKVKFSTPRFNTLQLINQVSTKSVSLSFGFMMMTAIKPLSPNLSCKVKLRSITSASDANDSMSASV